MLRALAGVARAAISRRGGPTPVVPGPWIEAELPPRPEALVRDFVTNSGGNPDAYRGHLPAHLFPQWGFPIAVRTLAGLPYPYSRAVNAGCRIDVRAPLPAGEPLIVRARLLSVDEDTRRAFITQELITGTRSAPDAMAAELRVHIPLAKGGRGAGKARPAVPSEAKEIASLSIGPRAGLEFAILTGDFNPIHWMRPWARIAGFRSTILHGFATLARAVEALTRGPLGSDPARLTSIDVRFTRPLVLPARVSVRTTDEGGLWVAGEDVYLEGRFETRG